MTQISLQELANSWQVAMVCRELKFNHHIDVVQCCTSFLLGIVILPRVELQQHCGADVSVGVFAQLFS